MNRLKAIKIVSILSPYENWDHSLVRELFHPLMALKLNGYMSDYPSGVLPCDTTDFVAAHILFCHETNVGLKPLMAFKITSLKVCEKHRISFPGMNLVQQAQAPEHISAVEKIMANCASQGRHLAYMSSWTADPEVRKNRPLMRELRIYFKGVYVLAHQALGIDEILIGGTLRFRTEKIFEELGHQAIKDENDRDLSLIHVKHLFGEEVLVMHLKSFSSHALDCASEMLEHWESRIEVGPLAQPIRAKSIRRVA
jgi:hypothetical protein